MKAWSRKRRAEDLVSIITDPTGVLYNDPVTWRRLVSRPGWMVVMIRYEKRSS